MDTALKTKLLLLVLGLLIWAPMVGAGWREEVEQPPAPSPAALSSTLVPNMPLEVYLYARQSHPTTIPAKMMDMPQDIVVDSLAIWGVQVDDIFALGIGLTLTDAGEASRVYPEISLEEDGWKKLSGKTIYVVKGSGPAAESLKTAISKDDFKYYDDSEALKAVAALPGGGATKLAAVAVAKPSKALIGLATKKAAPERLDMIDTMLKLANLKVIAGGLYSPHEIDVQQMAEVMNEGRSIHDLDLGFLVSLKSGLPGSIVRPAAEYFLTESEFVKTSLGEFTVYQGSFDIQDGLAVPALVRIEGNRVFLAVSGQESYAKTLIAGITV
jgi:hypothetical protein